MIQTRTRRMHCQRMHQDSDSPDVLVGVRFKFPGAFPVQLEVRGPHWQDHGGIAARFKVIFLPHFNLNLKFSRFDHRRAQYGGRLRVRVPTGHWQNLEVTRPGMLSISGCQWSSETF